MCDNLNKILLYNTNFHKNFHENQNNLFPEHDDLYEYLHARNKNDWNLKERLQKELRGFWILLIRTSNKNLQTKL